MKPIGINIAALLLAAPVWAGTPIDEKRPLDADGRLSVSNLAGSIEVSGWDRNEVAIAGQLGSDVEKLDIDGDARSLVVRVRYPNKLKGGVEESTLRIQVPRGATLALDAVSADVRVSATRGALTVNSVSGDIDVRTEAETIALNSVSGDVVCEAPAREARLQTVSGDIRTRGLKGGSVTAETVSGDVQLAGGGLRSVAVKSVSGDVLLEAGLDAAGTLRAESLSGDIRVRLAQAPDAVVNLKTFSGELSGDYARPGSDRRQAQATLGAGSGRIELNSFSGDLYLGK
ncbi:DUF4097 family beta strand repeat-containing protein [Fontimonas sp. SYSU GA230001]|uniref:DUF4097 family beta strand repeat-containing protein n=1 Tax=Fontimonas sp. SYSU GA230001 TaxID=3142450 RepID=UPI0032B38447